MATPLSPDNSTKAERKIISQLNRKEEVLRLLREMIIYQEIPVGYRLSEAELAERLGVSKTPLREALNALRGEGLVESAPWKGTRVISPTVQDVRGYFMVRQALELEAVREAIQGLNEKWVERLKRTITEMYHARETNDLRKYVDMDTAFHLTIANVSGNRWLIDTMQRIATFATLLRYATGHFMHGGRIEIPEDHDLIIEAMVAKDVERSEQLMLAHVERAKTEMLTYAELMEKANKSRGEGIS